jgi:glucokinase
MILAGDVGGTKVHLALYNFAGGRLAAVRDTKFPANEFATLDDVVKAFLGQAGGAKEQIAAACFGCPGPVRDGRLKLTNLPWTLDARLLQTSVGIEHIFLINDLEANGYGIPELAAESIFTLQAGDPSSVGHRGLVSAGTGLGEALLVCKDAAAYTDGVRGRALRLRGAQRSRDCAAELPATDAERESKF